MGPAALGTTENKSGAQNMKTGPDTLGTVENETGHAKHEEETQRPWYRRKRVRERKTRYRDPTPSVPPKTFPGAQNMKTGPDTLLTAGNNSGSAKLEKENRSPRYRRKLVWARKTLRRDPTPSVQPKTSPFAQNKKTGSAAFGTAGNESGRAKYENGT
jgi:hypothetical protein